jgi:hypothetical protein
MNGNLVGNQPVRNKNCLWLPCLLTNQAEMNNLYRGPSIYASYQCRKHAIYGRSSIKIAHFIPIRSQTWPPQEILVSDWVISKKKQPIRNKNSLWRLCLLANRAEISNLYRGPSIDASYQVTVHLTKRFQRRFFRTQPIRNKNCLWQPCFLANLLI